MVGTDLPYTSTWGGRNRHTTFWVPYLLDALDVGSLLLKQIKTNGGQEKCGQRCMAPTSAHHGDPLQLHSSMQNALMAPQELAWPHCRPCLPYLRFHLRHVLAAFQPQKPLVSHRSDEKWAPFGGSRQNATLSCILETCSNGPGKGGGVAEPDS